MGWIRYSDTLCAGWLGDDFSDEEVAHKIVQWLLIHVITEGRDDNAGLDFYELLPKEFLIHWYNFVTKPF